MYIISQILIFLFYVYQDIYQNKNILIAKYTLHVLNYIFE